MLGSVVGDDVTQAAEWRGRHQALVAQVQAAYIFRAQSIQSEDWEGAKAAYDEVLELSIQNQPTILIERMRSRLSND